MSSVSFASLLCSRLCHDLVSPVGALSNGVEILADEQSPEMREQVLGLLEQSARQTSNRLQFFRLAFGTGGNFAAEIDPREGHKALAAFLDGSRIRLNWNVGASGLDKSTLKLLLNLALVAAESIIREGELRIELHLPGRGGELAVTAMAQRLTLSDTMRAALSGQLREDALDPKTAPAYLASTLAREIAAEIAVFFETAETLKLIARFS